MRSKVQRPNGKPADSAAAPVAGDTKAPRTLTLTEHARRLIVDANNAVNRAAAMREAVINSVLAGAGVDPAARDGFAWKVEGDAESMTATWAPIESPVPPVVAAMIEEAVRAGAEPAGKPN